MLKKGISAFLLAGIIFFSFQGLHAETESEIDEERSYLGGIFFDARSFFSAVKSEWQKSKEEGRIKIPERTKQFFNLIGLPKKLVTDFSVAEKALKEKDVEAALDEMDEIFQKILPVGGDLLFAEWDSWSAQEKLSKLKGLLGPVADLRQKLVELRNALGPRITLSERFLDLWYEVVKEWKEVGRRIKSDWEKDEEGSLLQKALKSALKLGQAAALGVFEKTDIAKRIRERGEKEIELFSLLNKQRTKSFLIEIALLRWGQKVSEFSEPEPGVIFSEKELALKQKMEEKRVGLPKAKIPEKVLKDERTTTAVRFIFKLLKITPFATEDFLEELSSEYKKFLPERSYKGFSMQEYQDYLKVLKKDSLEEQFSGMEVVLSGLKEAVEADRKFWEEVDKSSELKEVISKSTGIKGLIALIGGEVGDISSNTYKGAIGKLFGLRKRILMDLQLARKTFEHLKAGEFEKISFDDLKKYLGDLS